MKEIKLYDALKVAKYGAEQGLTDKHGWKWARKYAKNPTKYIRMAWIFKAQRKQSTKLFKFGVEVPQSRKDAIAFDGKNENSLWADAIKKEIEQLLALSTFRILKKGTRKIAGFNYIPLYFAFDVKYDLRRKARLVAGGHATSPGAEDIYSGVVSIDNVRIALLLADLNNMQVVAADVGNAFLYGKTKEKLYSIAGKEFGEYEGCILIIDKSIYSLRTSTARLHEHLSANLRAMGFLPCQTDPDVWIRD